MSDFTDSTPQRDITPKLTTADLNRFSRALIGSLEKSNLDGDPFPDDLKKKIVSEFYEEMPNFIHVVGQGAPHTREAMVKIAETVKQKILTRMEDGQYAYHSGHAVKPADMRAPEDYALHENRTHASAEQEEPYTEPRIKFFNDKAIVEAAFSAAIAALKPTPEQAATADLKVEDITRFGSEFVARATDRNAASSAIGYMSRSTTFVNLKGNLPENKEDFKAWVAQVGGKAIDRTMYRITGSLPAPKRDVTELRKIAKTHGSSLTYEKMKGANKPPERESALSRMGRVLTELRDEQDHQDNADNQLAEEKRRAIGRAPKTRGSLETAFNSALESIVSPSKGASGSRGA